jgi:hypothetical protein
MLEAQTYIVDPYTSKSKQTNSRVSLWLAYGYVQWKPYIVIIVIHISLEKM